MNIQMPNFVCLPTILDESKLYFSRAIASNAVELSKIPNDIVGITGPPQYTRPGDSSYPIPTAATLKTQLNRQ